MDQIIIETGSEDKALIPDKWVLGTGLSTNSLYIVHTAGPLVIVQYPAASEIDHAPCTVYLNGNFDAENFNLLFAEAWKLLEIYKNRMNPQGL